MSVGVWSGSTLAWEQELAALKERMSTAFGRREVRETSGAFLDGLLSGIARKTGWQMAEQAGLSRPWRMQMLLGRTKWDADVLVDTVRDYVVEALGDGSGVLVVDETGFVKKGKHSVGVNRQYSGTAGRIENSQIGVFVAYASRYGQSLIDRQLYLPESWVDDPVRRKAASIPEDMEFATKPAMARAMLGKALDTGMPCAWVLADAVYGSDYRLRRMLEEREQPYVLAVRSNQSIRMLSPELAFVETNPAQMAAALSPADWRAHPAGEGTKGLRLYDWARVPLLWDTEPGFERWVLIRRSRADPEATAFYFAYAPTGASLADLAGAAGLRWTIEECFLRAKNDLGLDHCEARSWHGWHRHMSLVMAAAAFLAKLTADLRRAAWLTDNGKPNETSPIAA